jgi:hypothetical protein
VVKGGSVSSSASSSASGRLTSAPRLDSCIPWRLNCSTVDRSASVSTRLHLLLFAGQQQGGGRHQLHRPEACASA